MGELKKREEIDNKFKWNVDKVFKNIEEWEKDFQVLKSEAVTLKDYSGKLTNGEKILEYLKLNEKISRKQKNYIFMHI